MDIEKIKNIPIISDDVDEGTTLKEYLILLLDTLWYEDESFSGKRPFGNSGWQYEVYASLIRAGVIEGTLDEYGYIIDFNESKASKLVRTVIGSLN